MSIKVTCPNGHALKVKDEFAGKAGLCPHCKARRLSFPQRKGKRYQKTMCLRF